MTYTYDVNTAVGQVRLYSNDRDISPTTDAYLSDEEINLLLSKVNGIVYLAAAAALRIKALDKEYIKKSFTIGSYSESGGAQAAEVLNKKAKEYEDKAEAIGIGLDGEALVQEAIAEIAYTDDNWNQILLNKGLRGDTD